MSLYEKRAPVVLDETVPIATPRESGTVSIANEHTVRLLVGYLADGGGKTLQIYPEVLIPGEGWYPALSTAIDTSGAAIDADGNVPATVASPFIEVPGLAGVLVKLALDIPVPAGDSFRVRYLEDGHVELEPATVYLAAVASRGAT